MNFLFLIMSFFYEIIIPDVNEENFKYVNNNIQVSIDIFEDKYEEYKEYKKNNYFNGESVEQIAKKLNKHLNSTLKNKGEFIAKYSIKVGMDPYLATAVMLQETGCAWTCSYLTRTCNNVGGNKGSPSCNGGSYRRFSTIEDGIKFAINKLNSYYSKGQKSTYEIGPHYASDPLWPKRVNNYIKKLKS